MQPARAYTATMVENQKYHETTCIGLTSTHINLLKKCFLKHCKGKKKKENCPEKQTSLSMLNYHVIWPGVFKNISHS